MSKKHNKLPSAKINQPLANRIERIKSTSLASMSFVSLVNAAIEKGLPWLETNTPRKVKPSTTST